MTQKKCATFICYRNTVDNGYGKRIAEQIYNLINNDERFKPVFFAPVMGNYDFMKVQNVIKQCKRFIIVLSPRFFEDFRYEQDAAYKEVLSAFESDCVFVPVYDCELFSMKDKIKTIQSVFPDVSNSNLNRLIHKSGVSLKKKDFEYENVSGLLSLEENLDSPIISNHDLKMYLSNIANTIISHCIFQNQHEICNFKRTDTANVKKYIMLLFKTMYSETISKCGLPQLENFSTWAVELEEGTLELPINEPSDSISVCATCFGALLIDDWINIDCEVLGLHPPTELLANNMVKSAIELLLYLQDPVYGSWMASWDEATFVSGTINQTTLSLSTLFSCRFLDEAIEQYEKKATKKNLDILESRFEIIKKSIDWLLNAKKTVSYYHGDATSWGYMENNKTTNILPTVFCFDVLVKYEVILEKMMRVIKKEKQYESIKKERDKAINTIAEIITYFSVEEKEINSKKYVYAAIISRSLALYLLYHSSNTNAKLVNDRCFKILMEQDIDAMWTLDKNKYYFVEFGPDDILSNNDKEDSDYIYITNMGERYEICAEMIMADALIKNAMLSNRNGNIGIENEAMNKARAILKRFIDENVTLSHQKVFIRGKRNDYPRYPIYLLYYFRKVVHDVLLYDNFVDNQSNKS